MNPRKVMIHIESLNDVPIKILKEKDNLSLKVYASVFGSQWLDDDKYLDIDQVTVQVVKPEK